MTRIAITVEAYQALVATLPLGGVAYEPESNAKGERVIWLEEVWLSKLNAMRKRGGSYSDVILRLVDLGG
jgi:predicted CopG family antitoxin